MTLADAIAWTSRLAAIAATVAALELAWVHRAWRVGPLARGGRGGALVTAIAIAALLAGALALPWSTSAVPAWLAATGLLALAIRFRGSYNGGSDAMAWVVLLGLALARTAPDGELARAGLAYVAAQLVLGYVVAGIAKLGDPRWRDGTALAIVAGFPRYGAPAWFRAAVARAPIGRALAWAMLAFELGFPLALVDTRACLALIAVGAVFHLGNAIVFGLNRFLWTWLAAYPALLYWVDRLHGG